MVGKERTGGMQTVFHTQRKPEGVKRDSDFTEQMLSAHQNDLPIYSLGRHEANHLSYAGYYL